MSRALIATGIASHFQAGPECGSGASRGGGGGGGGARDESAHGGSNAADGGACNTSREEHSWPGGHVGGHQDDVAGAAALKFVAISPGVSVGE